MVAVALNMDEEDMDEVLRMRCLPVAPVRLASFFHAAQPSWSTLPSFRIFFGESGSSYRDGWRVGVGFPGLSWELPLSVSPRVLLS